MHQLACGILLPTAIAAYMERRVPWAQPSPQPSASEPQLEGLAAAAQRVERVCSRANRLLQRCCKGVARWKMALGTWAVLGNLWVLCRVWSSVVGTKY